MNPYPIDDLPEQVRLAKSADTPPDVLAALAASPSFQVQRQVGKNPHTPAGAFTRLSLRMQLQLAVAGDTPPETLAALAESPDTQVRYDVGRNPRTPTETLTRLSTDSGRCEMGPVFTAVLTNPRTPPEILARFVKHGDASVRRALAANPDIPCEWLTLLAKDENTRVRRAVAENPKTPLATFLRFVDDKCSDVRRCVAAHPQTHDDILSTLAEDEDRSVRENVARNPRTSGDILAVLSEDAEESVRQPALDALRMRTRRRPAAPRESAAERDFARAVRSFKTAEHELALELARRAARKGSARAQYFLGILYKHGFCRGLAHEPDRKRKRAAYRLQKAADLGYREKALVGSFDEEWQLFCAGEFANPDNPRRDDDKAAEYYRRAVEGDPYSEAVDDRYGRSCSVLAMKFLLELYGAGRGMAADTDLWLMERAAKGDHLAMSALARLFAEGHGVSGERRRVVRRLKKATRESANKCVLRRDEFNENVARFELGLSYLEGRGIERNDVQAARWLERAANYLKTAQYMTGHLYREGRGVERSAAKAIHWYRKACERNEARLDELDQAEEYEKTVEERLDDRRRTADGKAWAAIHALLRAEAKRGNADACYVLGIFHLDGMGVEENPKRAAFWVKKAAQAGDEAAQYLFGDFAEQGVGMAENHRTALRWRGKAAEKNFEYVDVDYNECFGGNDLDGADERERWLRRQTRKGNAFAPFQLTLFRSCCKTPARRTALLRLAAERGNMTAQFALGLAHCSGDGVKQDYARAAYWFQRASVNPEPSPHFDKEPGWPQSELAHLYREGKGVERDPVLAAYWYETSLHDLNCCSELALAMAYECGYGVEADLEKARHLYRRAIRTKLGGKGAAAFSLEMVDDPAAGEKTRYWHSRAQPMRQGAGELAAFFLELMDEDI